MNLSVERILYLADKYPEIIIKLDGLDRSMDNIQNPSMTFDEACDFLHYKKNSLYKLCCRDQIPHYKPNGKTLLFYKSELDDWICGRKDYTIEELAAIRHRAMASTASIRRLPATTQQPEEIN